jgi:hypothetical protein
MTGRSHDREVLARAARCIQHDAVRRTGMQQSGDPLELCLDGVGIVVVGRGLLVIRGHDGRTPLGEPSLSIQVASSHPHHRSRADWRPKQRSGPRPTPRESPCEVRWRCRAAVGGMRRGPALRVTLTLCGVGTRGDQSVRGAPVILGGLPAPRLSTWDWGRSTLQPPGEARMNDGPQELNWRTVLPSVTTGGLAIALTFSLTHSAARREDSSVPALSWQTVTVMPPSPLRTAA